MRDYEIFRKALMDAWRGQYCSDCELNSLCQDDDSNCWFKQAADAIEELLAKVPTWISVEERLPEEYKDVLCYCEYFRYGDYNCMFRAIDRGYYGNGRWGGEAGQGHKNKVLAWMPLPAPPKEVE